jgi:hypothetical protein
MNRVTAIALAIVASGCQSATGLHITVIGAGLTVDQLMVTASWSGKTMTRAVPPSPAPLALPTDFFASFDPQATTIDLAVAAFNGGQQIVSAATMGLMLSPHHVTEVTVNLLTGTIDAGPMDLGGMDFGGMDFGGLDLSGMAAMYMPAVLADKPVAYYRLADTGLTAVDSSGNALDGSYGSSSITHGPGLVGDGNGAAIFPGGVFTNKSIVLVQPNPRLEPSVGVSVEVWLRPSASNQRAVLVEYGDGPVSLSPSWGVMMGGGVLGAFLNTANGQTGSAGFLGATAPVVGQTYHCVTTYDGATLKVYVNGAIDASRTYTGGLRYTVGQSGLGIGGSADGDPSNGDVIFAGTLDEVAVYDHALSADAIAAHYHAAKP